MLLGVADCVSVSRFGLFWACFLLPRVRFRLVCELGVLGCVGGGGASGDREGGGTSQLAGNTCLSAGSTWWSVMLLRDRNVW